MDSERVSSMGQSFDPYRPLLDIHILVVDDDTTTLSIVSAMLRTWSYKVMSVKNPLDALATLRTQQGLIDLVVTDLHMPYMNGFELQQQIDKEFKLPVIMMSADDKESVVLRSLQSGISLFILKPVSPNDLKNVWQYAIKAKKGKSVVIEEIGSNDVINNQGLGQGQGEGEDLIIGESSGTSVGKEITPYDPNMNNIYNNGDNNNNNNNLGSSSSAGAVAVTAGTLVPMSQGKVRPSSSSANNNRRPPSDCNRKGPKKPRDDRDDKKERKSRRKAKVVWTNSLHNRFLLAIRHLGLDKAVPKRILEFMNVPGLTRENVASHLQKYRLFLKKVAEKGLLNATQVLADRVFRSSFAAGYPQLMMKNLQVSRNQPFRLSEPSFPPTKFNNNNINNTTHNFVPDSSNSSLSVVSNLSPTSLGSTGTTSTTTTTTTPPFRAFQTPPGQYNINMINNQQEASSGRPLIMQPQQGLSSLLISNIRPANVDQQPMVNPVYNNQAPNRQAGFGGVLAAGPSNMNMFNSTNGTNGNVVVPAPAAVNLYGLIMNNANSNGFANGSAGFNGTTIWNRPDYTLAAGNMMVPYNSTNGAAAAAANYNYFNGAAAGGSAGISGFNQRSGGGFVNGTGAGYGMENGVPNYGNYMNGMSTNFGYPQMGQFGAGSSSCSGQYGGFGVSTSTSAGMSSPLQPVFPNNNVNYLPQQNAYNLPPQMVAAPPPPPPQPQQQYAFDLQNMGGGNRNIGGGDHQMGDVINSNSIFDVNPSTAFGAELPFAGGFDDFGGDLFADIQNNALPPLDFQQDVEEVLSDLSDISYQAEVNPSPNGQVQNPAGAGADDQFSPGPFQVQENAVPYNDGQSFGQVQQQGNDQPALLPSPNNTTSLYPSDEDYFPLFDQFPYQQQGIGEVLDADLLTNPPTNMPNEMDWDWDEYMDSMLNDNGPESME